MPLSLQIVTGAGSSVGNAYTQGQPISSYKNDYSLASNYSLTEEDYKAGFVQFAHVVKIRLNTPTNLPWIGFAESNPRRYLLGEYSLGNGLGIIQKRGIIDHTNYDITNYSPLFPLNRNEAARPRNLKLSARPRAIISNSDSVTFDYYGSVTLAPTIYSGGGTLTTPPNPFTESGTIVSNGITTLKTDIPRRAFKFDITDGSLELQEQREAGNYYPNSVISTANEGFSINRVYLYLYPGVTGQISIDTYKVGEFVFLPLIQLPTYTPGNFPNVL